VKGHMLVEISIIYIGTIQKRGICTLTGQRQMV